MVDVVNRTTKEYLTSENEPDYPLVDWIHDPDLTAVTGFSSKYWIITGDSITLMDQAARDAVDAAELEAMRTALVTRLDDLEDILRQVLIVLKNELNRHADKHNEILDAADNATSLATFKNGMAAITDYPQRTLQQLRDQVRAGLGNGG